MPEQNTPAWSDLAQHPLPSWFREAKFGIYAHWGPYSVPACGTNGCWYPHLMYVDDHPVNRFHRETYGAPQQFGYKDFIPLFKAEQFDAGAWAELFRKSGAKFAGPVAEHHDGFSMWKTGLSKWNAVAMGPRRDVVGELAEAVRAEGMRFLTTFHHAWNWWYYPTHDARFDCADPQYAGLYSRPHAEDEPPDEQYLTLWRKKVAEVVESYRPDMLWFDFGLGHLRDRARREMLAHYYNQAAERGQEVGVLFKEMQGNPNLAPGSGILDWELGKSNRLAYHAWITDTTVDASPDGGWSHVPELGFKSPERLIHNLVDRVSKNGYLLLNVPPRADGTIPEGAEECLLEMGKWLEINGEAVYGTTPWICPGEGPTKTEGASHFNEMSEPRFIAQDVRYTTKDDCLYATCLGRPGERVVLRAPVASEGRPGRPWLYPEDVRSIHMLGRDEELTWRWRPDGLQIDVPPRVPNPIAVAFRIRTA